MSVPFRAGHDRWPRDVDMAGLAGQCVQGRSGDTVCQVLVNKPELVAVPPLADLALNGSQKVHDDLLVRNVLVKQAKPQRYAADPVAHNRMSEILPDYLARIRRCRQLANIGPLPMVVARLFRPVRRLVGTGHDLRDVPDKRATLAEKVTG